LTNHNDVFYECDHHYDLAKKCKVALAFLQLEEENAPSYPSVHQLAKWAKEGWHYANLVGRELRDNGKSLANLVNRAIMHHHKTTKDGECCCFLNPVEEIFLLTLKAEDRTIPTLNYILELVQ
jgi:hypothetical protein